jgi:hypothetical protein
LTANTPKRVAIECSTPFKPGEDRNFCTQFAYCVDDIAPRRYVEEGKFTSALSTSAQLSEADGHSGVIPLCSVKVDMSSEPESKFMRARASTSGELFLVAEFSIEIEVDNARLKFVLAIEDKECGVVEARFDG